MNVSSDSFLVEQQPGHPFPCRWLSGVISKSQQCKFCGSQMQIKLQDEHLNWLCQSRVDKVKCNKNSNGKNNPSKIATQ